MGEVEQVRMAVVDHDIGVMALVIIISAGARFLEQVIRLPGPVEGIVGAVHTQTGPVVDDHPQPFLKTEDLGALAGFVADGLAFVLPVVQVGAVGIVNGFGVFFIVEPHAPITVGHSEDTGVDDFVIDQGQGGLVVPVEEVFAGQVEDVARMGPVFKDAGNIGQVHVVGAVVFDDIGGPVGVVSFDVIDIGVLAVGPCNAAVVGFGDADGAAVYPCYAGQSRDIGPTAGVKHEPFLLALVPDDDRIGRAVKNRVTVERFWRDAAHCAGLPAAGRQEG